jgi:hypothetical protein
MITDEKLQVLFNHEVTHVEERLDEVLKAKEWRKRMFKEMTNNELLDYCKDSGAKWAAAFMECTENQAITEDLMVAWFCSAIEQSCYFRKSEGK